MHSYPLAKVRALVFVALLVAGCEVQPFHVEEVDHDLTRLSGCYAFSDTVESLALTVDDLVVPFMKYTTSYSVTMAATDSLVHRFSATQTHRVARDGLDSTRVGRIVASRTLEHTGFMPSDGSQRPRLEPMQEASASVVVGFRQEAGASFLILWFPAWEFPWFDAGHQVAHPDLGRVRLLSVECGDEGG